jgi:hypothetical protein
MKMEPGWTRAHTSALAIGLSPSSRFWCNDEQQILFSFQVTGSTWLTAAYQDQSCNNDQIQRSRYWKKRGPMKIIIYLFIDPGIFHQPHSLERSPCDTTVGSNPGGQTATGQHHRATGLLVREKKHLWTDHFPSAIVNDLSPINYKNKLKIYPLDPNDFCTRICYS